MPRKLVIVIAAAVIPATAAVVAAWIMASRSTALPPMVSLKDAMTNPTGWEWLMPPREVDVDRDWPVRAMWMSDEATLTVLGTAPDELYASVTRFAPVEEAPLKTRFRLIEIKEDGRREKGRAVSSTWRPDGLSVAVYRLNWNDEDPARTKMIGLEVCPPEGKRLIAAEAAAEAAAAGIAVPGLPEIDQPYAFELTDVAGNAIRSADLRGKVVLLNIWATWCGPCMAKLPVLQEVYEQHHALGLEIVAISLDRDVADPVGVYADRDIEWPLVFVPTDKQTRDLWRRATDTYGIPRVLLIDREGVMREDLHGADLAERVGAYFEPMAAAGG